jgi:hypothetical protein
LTDFGKSIDALFMGRKSYDLTKKIGGSNPWGGMTIYVFSNPTEPSKDPRVVIV